MYKNCQNWEDRIECVQSLINKCLDLSTGLGYSADDARTIGLNSVKEIAQYSLMILNILDSWHRGSEDVKALIPQIIQLQNLTQDAADSCANILEQNARLNLVLVGQFRIENCLKNINSELQIPSQGTGFYKTARALLNRLGIPNGNLSIINVPALIRNSLHRNGIHTQQNATVTLDGGVIYDFVEGDVVHCASWEHIAHSLECSVGVLEKIFNEPNVSALTDPVPDLYAAAI